MKTQKLNLNELKVESFVTSLEEKDSQTVKGGSSVACSTVPCATLVVASIVVFSVGTIIATVNKKDEICDSNACDTIANETFQCCVVYTLDANG